MAAMMEAGTSASGGKVDKLKRLRDLQMRRNEARKLNHQAVIEEDRQKKLPKNFESKKARLEWEQADEQKRKDCDEKGEDYDRVKLLTVGADEAERWERKRKKRNPDVGFSDYAAASARHYQTLTKQIKPNMDTYKQKKEECGEQFYPTTSTLIDQQKDSTDAIDRMVQDLEKQVEKRGKFSRRRAFDEEVDIDYINERNMKFNKKLDRFYGQYTAEIKQNLERGTAV